MQWFSVLWDPKVSKEMAGGAVKAEVESEAEGLELQSSASLPQINAFPFFTFYILIFHVKVNSEKDFYW